MKKTIIFCIVVSILFFGCTKDAINVSIGADDIIRWDVQERGGITSYEFRESLFGSGRLTTRRLNMSTMQFDTKTIDATMSDIVSTNEFMSFRINGVKYVYRPNR